MDKHKQFTETKHPVGTVLEPGATTIPVDRPKPFKFSDADLSSDFSEVIDPGAVAAEPTPATEPKAALHEAPMVEPSASAQPIAATTPAAVSPGPSIFEKPKGRVGQLLGNPYIRWGGLAVGVLLLVSGSMWVGKSYMKKSPQVISDSTKLDQATLLVDSEKHSVGIKTGANPDGLEVQASVSAAPQGSANIRMGLVNGTDPSIFFEDNQKNSWQVLGAGGSFQVIQGEQTRAKLDDKALSLTNALNVGSDANVAGNTTLGKDGANLLTIQGTKVAIPNNLNFADNTFVIEASKGNVAIGSGTASGYKLLVNGSIKSNTNVYADGQVLAGAGSVKNPSFSFNNNTNTGMYEASLNAIGFAAGGGQVLQVQSGLVATVNGASIEADGYLRAGRGGSNPSFQVARYTGTLDGSGNATVSTGLGTGNTRVLTSKAFYRGNSSEALPLNIDAVYGSTMVVSGGIPGRQFRASIIYSSDGAGW